MKRFTLVLLLILCLAMVFTLGSCNKTDTNTEDSNAENAAEELLMGEWKSEIDLGSLLVESMGDQ